MDTAGEHAAAGTEHLQRQRRKWDSAALSQFYQAASTWSTDPGDTTDQSSVLNAAQSVAQAFQQQSTELSQATTTANGQLTSLVGQVNKLAGQIQQDNATLAQQGPGDSALQANVYSTLQQLAQIVPITSFTASDGSTTVLLGGQTPLVIGQTQYQVGSKLSVPANASIPGGLPATQILDSNGNDITSQVTGGELGGLAAGQCDAGATAGELLAAGFSEPTGAGLRQPGEHPSDLGKYQRRQRHHRGGCCSGHSLIHLRRRQSFDRGANAVGESGHHGSQLAAIDPGPPEVANGVPLALANLAASTNPADQIDGLNYAAYYGQMAGNLGSAISTAQTNQTTAQSMVTQAENVRQQASGVGSQPGGGDRDAVPARLRCCRENGQRPGPTDPGCGEYDPVGVAEKDQYVCRNQPIGATIRQQRQPDSVGAQHRRATDFVRGEFDQPSDAPDEVSPVLQLLTQVQANQAMQTNLTAVQGNVNAAESALSSSVDPAAERLHPASEATGPSETAATRSTLAGSVQALLQEMVSNSQTAVNGQYVFSGDQSGSPLYQLDLNAPNGVDKLGVATNTNMVQLPGAARFR